MSGMRRERVAWSIFMLPICVVAVALLTISSVTGRQPLWLTVPFLLVCLGNGIHHAGVLRVAASAGARDDGPTHAQIDASRAQAGLPPLYADEADR